MPYSYAQYHMNTSGNSTFLVGFYSPLLYSVRNFFQTKHASIAVRVRSMAWPCLLPLVKSLLPKVPSVRCFRALASWKLEVRVRSSRPPSPQSCLSVVSMRNPESFVRDLAHSICFWETVCYIMLCINGSTVTTCQSRD